MITKLMPVLFNTLSCLVINIKKYIQYRFSSRGYLTPRTDSTDLWHLYTGHYKKEALESLVIKARNVKISGITIVKCLSYTRAYTSQIIS